MKSIYLVLLFICFISYHLVTLCLSPLPWLDEIMFSSISHSLATEGTYYCRLIPLAMDGKEILVYGPVYFTLTAFVEKVFGFGMFQFRIVGFTAGLIYLLLALTVFQRLFPSSAKARSLFILLLMLDPVLNSGMHGGRMDILAACFVLGSVYFCLRTNSIEGSLKSVALIGLSGLLGSLAVLTTPRTVILLLPVMIILFARTYRILNLKCLMEMMAWGFLFLLPLATWIIFAYESVSHFVSSFSQVNSQNASFGGNLFNLRYIGNYALTQYPLLIVFLFFTVTGMIKRGKDFFSERIFICLLTVILFYLLIFEVGAYYVMIIPYLYFLILEYYQLDFIPAWIRRGFVYSLLLFNVSFFAMKTIHLSQSIEARDPGPIRNFLNQAIPSGSRVIGDELYYYAVQGNHSEYQLINWYGHSTKSEEQHRRNFDYEYLICSDAFAKKNPDVMKLYSENTDLRLLGRYEAGVDVPMINIPGAGKVFSSYNCTVYKREKEEVGE